MAEQQFPANESLTNYSYSDIATGTGYQTYYAGRSTAASILSDITFYSNGVDPSANIITDPYTGDNGTDVAYALSIDLDFDFTVNRPLNLSGLAIVNVPYGVKHAAGAGTSFAKCRVVLKKYADAAETTIATSAYSIGIESGDAANPTQGLACLSLNISTVTHFKRGDILRLTVEVYGYVTNGGSTYSTMLIHDPVARTYTHGTTTFTSSRILAQIPFKIPV